MNCRCMRLSGCRPAKVTSGSCVVMFWFTDWTNDCMCVCVYMYIYTERYMTSVHCWVSARTPSVRIWSMRQWVRCGGRTSWNHHLTMQRSTQTTSLLLLTASPRWWLRWESALCTATRLVLRLSLLESVLSLCIWWWWWWWWQCSVDDVYV